MPAHEPDRPPDAWRLGAGLVAEMAAWSLLLPALKRILPVRRMVALMWNAGGVERSEGREKQILAMSARLTGLRFRRRSNCLERSLLAYRFLARSGADPRLVLGASTAGGEFFGHAWVTLDGEPVYESREALEDFAPLIEFGAGGAVTHAAPTADRAEFVRAWR